MSNSYFHFKQFTIHHDRCAMKVGTDGVLLGAWAELPAEGRVLDIGTGSGVVALMVAQRGEHLHVTGIDIDADAVGQAAENAAASPFASRVSMQAASLLDYTESACGCQREVSGRVGAAPCVQSPQAQLFDAVVCNPPYHEETLLPPDAQRRDARHTVSMPFSQLVDCASRLLTDGGVLSVVLPSLAFDSFNQLCEQSGLRLSRLCHVRTTSRKQPKRVLATFRKQAAAAASSPVVEELVLQDGPARSAAYAALTEAFYLH